MVAFIFLWRMEMAILRGEVRFFIGWNEREWYSTVLSSPIDLQRVKFSYTNSCRHYLSILLHFSVATLRLLAPRSGKKIAGNRSWCISTVWAGTPQWSMERYLRKKPYHPGGRRRRSRISKELSSELSARKRYSRSKNGLEKISDLLFFFISVSFSSLSLSAPLSHMMLEYNIYVDTSREIAWFSLFRDFDLA